MSKNYVKAVLDHLPALTSPTDTLVLLAIAEYTSDETRLAWPSVRTIARRTRLHERNVQRALRRLEALGMIHTTPGGYYGEGNHASVYRLDFDHRGIELKTKSTPKRVPVAAPPKPQPAAAQPAPMPAQLRARLKRIPTDDASFDVNAAKERTAAAVRKILESS